MKTYLNTLLAGLAALAVTAPANASALNPRNQVSDTSFEVQATTTMDGATMTSEIVRFSGYAAHLVTQVTLEDGVYDFQLVADPVSQPNVLVLENMYRWPVQFTVTQPGGPIIDQVVVEGGEIATLDLTDT